jgi:2-polyprenyl-3-methyl-5-hydroxy-6-metoxy-1,4-benzoquinol methylase
VLDIGVMEGRFSILAARAGGHVMAYDPLDLSPRINLVQEAYGVSFDYRPGEPFHKSTAKYHAEGFRGFQAIIFSGVLYHTVDPSIFLYYVQNLFRPGGYMVLQTSIVVDDECFRQFKDRERFTGVTKFYQVSNGWLNYILRFFGF